MNTEVKGCGDSVISLLEPLAVDISTSSCTLSVSCPPSIFKEIMNTRKDYVILNDKEFLEFER